MNQQPWVHRLIHKPSIIKYWKYLRQYNGLWGHLLIEQMWTTKHINREYMWWDNSHWRLFNCKYSPLNNTTTTVAISRRRRRRKLEMEEREWDCKPNCSRQQKIEREGQLRRVYSFSYGCCDSHVLGTGFDKRENTLLVCVGSMLRSLHLWLFEGSGRSSSSSSSSWVVVVVVVVVIVLIVLLIFCSSYAALRRVVEKIVVWGIHHHQ